VHPHPHQPSGMYVPQLYLFTSLNEIVQHMKGTKDSNRYPALFLIEKSLLTDMSIVGGCEDVGTVRCDGVYCRIVS
jgi:hypothetical protein